MDRTSVKREAELFKRPFTEDSGDLIIEGSAVVTDAGGIDFVPTPGAETLLAFDGDGQLDFSRSEVRCRSLGIEVLDA